MAFVNEYIPSSDYRKFNFDALNSRLREASGTTPSDSWTVDRDANIWLRKFYTENDHTAVAGGFTGVAVWDYFWRGALMSVKVMTLETGGEIGKPCWERKRLLGIDVPPELEEMRPAILRDLEAAFLAYKDGGVLSEASTFSFVLEV